MHVSMEEHIFVTVNGLRVKIKMPYKLARQTRMQSDILGKIAYVSRKRKEEAT